MWLLYINGSIYCFPGLIDCSYLENKNPNWQSNWRMVLYRCIVPPYKLHAGCNCLDVNLMSPHVVLIIKAVEPIELNSRSHVGVITHRWTWLTSLFYSFIYLLLFIYSFIYLFLFFFGGGGGGGLYLTTQQLHWAGCVGWHGILAPAHLHYCFIGFILI